MPKLYVARIQRDGNVAPTITVLHNTIGNIIWTHGDVGEDWGTLAGAFPSDKTAMFLLGGPMGTAPILNVAGNPIGYITVGAAGAPDHVEVITNVPGEGEVNDFQVDFFFEIRVYP